MKKMINNYDDYDYQYAEWVVNKSNNESKTTPSDRQWTKWKYQAKTGYGKYSLDDILATYNLTPSQLLKLEKWGFKRVRKRFNEI